MKRTFSWTLVVLCGMTLTMTALLGPGRLWGQRIGTQAALTADTTSFEFALELDGEAVAFFHKCTGLVSASDVYEETVLTTAGLQMDQKRPGGRLLWENITLTYNVGTNDAWLWRWRDLVETDSWEGALRDGVIVLYGPGGETARWTFTNGWPVRLSIDESVGKITIAHDGLKRVSDEPIARTR
jgi:phage tail-like protein